MLLLAVLLALLIGLSLGAVGGGGSILAVPVLIGVAGMSVNGATTASLVVVGVSSLVGMVAHHLAGRVRFGAGLAFGLTGVGGALVGTRVHELLDPNVLLVAFAALMLAVATRMALNLRRSAPRSASLPPETTEMPPPGNRATLTATARTTATVARVPAPTGTPAALPRLDSRRVAAIVVTGSSVGFLTGLLGVGGGFVIVPALMLVLGFPLAEATGTSLLVIAVNSAVALAMRGGLSTIDWSIVAPFTVSAVGGVLLGRRVADRVPARTLTTALTILIVTVALWTAARGLSGLF